MPDYDAETLAEQALMIGLVDKDQAMQARFEAEDGSPESLLRVLLRKGLLTSWQVERLQKGDPSGFFYGGCKVLFHIAEGTFARVYRGQRMIGGIRSPSRCSANASSPTPTQSPGFARKPRPE